MISRPQGASPYETWVLTLRAWSSDPRTPLDHLPALASDMFTPDTYGRLIDHLVRAIQAATERWEGALHQLTATARTDQELAMGLVDLRNTLARRVQLVSHPALPPEIRDALTKENRAAIERFQHEFEEALMNQARAGHALQAGLQQTLATVRANPFTEVLDREMRLDGTTLRGRVAYADQPPPSAPGPRVAPVSPAPQDAPPMTRRSYRRITLLGLTDQAE